MSLSTGNVTKSSIAEFANSVEWLDLSSRGSVVAGNRASFFNRSGTSNAIVGFGAASHESSTFGSDLAFFGTNAGYRNQGDYNTWVGSKAGQENEAGSENTGVGYLSGGTQKSSWGNSLLGFRAGLSSLGSGNVAIGHSALDTDAAGDSNVVLGSLSQAGGHRNVVIGAYSYADGGSVVVGYDSEASSGSVVIGTNVTSTGTRSLFISPTRDGTAFSSSASGALNVFGILTGAPGADGRFAASLNADAVTVGGEGARVFVREGSVSMSAASNISFLSATMFGGNASFSKPAVFSDEALFIGGIRTSPPGASVFDGRVTFNGQVDFGDDARLNARHLTVTGTANLQDVTARAIDTGALSATGPVSLPPDAIPNPVFSSVVNHGSLTNIGPATFKSGIHVCCGIAEIDNLKAHSFETVHFKVTGDADFGDSRVEVAEIHVGKGFFDEVSVSSNLVGGGTLVFATAQIQNLAAGSVETSLLKAATAELAVVAADKIAVRDIEGFNAAFSNLVVDSITVTGAGGGDFNLSLYNAKLTGVTEANALIVAKDAAFGGDVTVSGVLTAERLEITGGFSFASGLPVVFDDAVVANSTLTVRGEAVFGAGVQAASVEAETITATGHVTTKGCIVWDNPLGPSYWRACLEDATAHSADLTFRSSLGTTFTLCDNFEPGVLNFTGKHRCSLEGPLPPGGGAGMLVVTTGDVRNLDGSTVPGLDESLPVVRLSMEARDPRAYGVIAGSEAEGEDRRFRLASIVFGCARDDAREAKVIVNSAGEGGMWVCNETGEPLNGDLLETSSFPGHARRQVDDVVRSTTVAKVAADVRGWTRACVGMARAFAAVVYKF